MKRWCFFPRSFRFRWNWKKNASTSCIKRHDISVCGDAAIRFELFSYCLCRKIKRSWINFASKKETRRTRQRAKWKREEKNIINIINCIKMTRKTDFFFSFSIGFLLFYKDTDTSYKVFFASQLSEANIMHICVHKCQMLMNIIEKYSKKANWNAIQNRPHMAHMRHITA